MFTRTADNTTIAKAV